MRLLKDLSIILINLADFEKRFKINIYNKALDGLDRELCYLLGYFRGQQLIFRKISFKKLRNLQVYMIEI